MAEHIKARRAEGFFGINGVNVWGDIKKYVTDITFTENATGETDSFDITLADVDEKFINEWLIDPGTEIDAKFKLTGWEKDGEEYWIDCGSFLVDAVKIKGVPIEVTVQAVALPVKGTKNTKKWEDISAAQIAEDMCGYLGVELEFYADDVTVKSKQQSRQTDIDFLYSLCKDYGYGMKVYRNSIVIYPREEQDAAKSVGTIHIREMSSSFTLDDNESEVYTGASCPYKTEDMDDEVTYTYGTDECMLILDSTASSMKEAELKAKAALYDANSERITLKFTTAEMHAIYPGTNYYIDGLGAYTGKYAIDKATHTLSGKAMYKTEVECRFIG